MKQILRNVLDYSNICFALLGIGFFNCMIFYPGTWMFLTFYAVFLGVNIYCCYIVLKVKNLSIERVLQGCDRNEAEVSEDPNKRDAVETELRSRIQWGDIAELVFGKFFGRLLTESSLFVFVLTSGTAQMCLVRLIGVLTFYSSPGQSVNNNTNVVGIEEYEDLLDVNNDAIYGAMLIIFMLSCAFFRYRQVGIFSLLGFVIIFAESLKVGHLTMILSSIPVDEIIPTSINNSYQSFVFQSCGPQIAGMILTIHNNMIDNENNFAATICVGSVVSLFVIILIGASLLLLPYYGPGIPFSTIVMMCSPFAWKVVVVLGYFLFFLLLNIPLFDLVERWMSFCLCHKAVFESGEQSVRISRIQDTVDLFTPDHEGQSVFGQLHHDKNAVLNSSQVISDVRKQIPLGVRILLRVAMIALEWVGGFLIWGSPAGLEIFAIFQTASTLFSGFVVPFLLFLKLVWSGSGVLNKLLCLSIIVGAIVWNVLAFTKVHLITNLF